MLAKVSDRMQLWDDDDGGGDEQLWGVFFLSP